MTPVQEREWLAAYEARTKAIAAAGSSIGGAIFFASALAALIVRYGIA